MSPLLYYRARDRSQRKRRCTSTVRPGRLHRGFPQFFCFTTGAVISPPAPAHDAGTDAAAGYPTSARLEYLLVPLMFWPDAPLVVATPSERCAATSYQSTASNALRDAAPAARRTRLANETKLFRTPRPLLILLWRFLFFADENGDCVYCVC